MKLGRELRTVFFFSLLLALLRYADCSVVQIWDADFLFGESFA